MELLFVFCNLNCVQMGLFLLVSQFVAETGGFRDRTNLETDSSFPKHLVG